LVRSLGSSPIAKVHGIDALLERTVEHWDRGYDPFQAVIGVADIDGSWALIAEMNGYVGVTERLIGPISTGRTIVSHYRNINAVHRFNWWRAGRLLVDLDLLFPTERFGADPDALLEDVRGVGIPLDAESDDIAGMDLSAAGFALAQRITNVACTPEFSSAAISSSRSSPCPTARNSNDTVRRFELPGTYQQSGEAGSV
jgi:Family of unknown function (DUF6461)